MQKWDWDAYLVLQDLIVFILLRNCLAYCRTKLFFQTPDTNDLKWRSTFSSGAECTCHVSALGGIRRWLVAINSYTIHCRSWINYAKRKCAGEKQVCLFWWRQGNAIQTTQLIYLPLTDLTSDLGLFKFSCFFKMKETILQLKINYQESGSTSTLHFTETFGVKLHIS